MITTNYRAWDNVEKRHQYDFLEFGDKQENNLHLLTVSNNLYNYATGRYVLQLRSDEKCFETGDAIFEGDIVQTTRRRGEHKYHVIRGRNSELMLSDEPDELEYGIPLSAFDLKVVGHIHEGSN